MYWNYFFKNDLVIITNKLEIYNITENSQNLYTFQKIIESIMAIAKYIFYLNYYTIFIFIFLVRGPKFIKI